jgi:5-methylcytosine-specific restriction endonuclease McrA
VARHPNTWGGRKVDALRYLVLSTYGTVCHLCGGQGADSPDHVIPRSKGGSNALDNLRPAHRGCNIARGDMDLAEWFTRHPLPARPALQPSRKWI